MQNEPFGSLHDNVEHIEGLNRRFGRVGFSSTYFSESAVEKTVAQT